MLFFTAFSDKVKKSSLKDYGTQPDWLLAKLDAIVKDVELPNEWQFYCQPEILLQNPDGGFCAAGNIACRTYEQIMQYEKSSVVQFAICCYKGQNTIYAVFEIGIDKPTRYGFNGYGSRTEEDMANYPFIVNLVKKIKHAWQY